MNSSNACYEMMVQAANTVKAELSLLFCDGEYWSDSDSDRITPEELEYEIFILRSFMEYFYSKGTFPFSNPNSAHDFVSSGNPMSLTEFHINIQRLKNRYKKRLWKVCKDFQLLENVREQHAFDLGNRLWGTMSVEMLRLSQEQQHKQQQQDDESMASAEEEKNDKENEEEGGDGKEKEDGDIKGGENDDGDNKGDGEKEDADNKGGDGEKEDADNKGGDGEKEDADNKGGDGEKEEADNKGGDGEKEDADNKGGDGKDDADNKGDGKDDADNKDGVVGEYPVLKNVFGFESVLKMPVVSKEAVEKGLVSFGEDRVKNWEKRWKELEIEELKAFLAKVSTIRHYANTLMKELQGKTLP